MTPEDVSRGRFRKWLVLVLLLLPALALFAWAGSGNPRNALPWTWTKTEWIVPAAGLAWLWCFAGLLFWLLSEIAWLLFNPVEGSRKLKVWASAGIILGLGLIVRIAILATWTPLDPAAGWRWVAILGDLAAIGLLMLALAGAGRSLWWAALYAFHPLVLVEVVGNGHWVGWVLVPIVFVAGVGHRLPRMVSYMLGLVAAFVALAMLVLGGRGGMFNSLAADLVSPGSLPVVAALFLVVVLLIGRLRDWPIARVLAHIAVVALMCSPVAKPWAAVFVAALLPLAWARAGWVMSIAVLAAYAARLTSNGQVPEWLLMVEWMPVWVLEIHELGAEAMAALMHSRAKTFPAATSAVP